MRTIMIAVCAKMFTRFEIVSLVIACRFSLKYKIPDTPDALGQSMF